MWHALANREWAEVMHLHQAEAVRNRCAFSISLCIDLCRLVSEYQGFLEATCWRWLRLAQKKVWVPEWLCGAELTDHTELWQEQAINFHCTKSFRFGGSAVIAVSINQCSCTAEGQGLCNKPPSSSLPKVFDSFAKIRVGFWFFDF